MVGKKGTFEEVDADSGGACFFSGGRSAFLNEGDLSKAHRKKRFSGDREGHRAP